MPNQMIALQARGPQLPDLSRQTAQIANMMNMARQQEAAQLQGQRARQEMEYATAAEGRAVQTQTSAQKKADLEYIGLATKQFSEDVAKLKEGDLAGAEAVRADIIAKIPAWDKFIRPASEWTPEYITQIMSKASEIVAQTNPPAESTIEYSAKGARDAQGRLLPEGTPIQVITGRRSSATPILAAGDTATPAPTAAPTAPQAMGTGADMRATQGSNTTPQDLIGQGMDPRNIPSGMPTSPASFTRGSMGAGQMTPEVMSRITDSAFQTGVIAQVDFDQLLATQPPENRQAFTDAFRRANITLQADAPSLADSAMGQQQMAANPVQTPQAEFAVMRGPPPQSRTANLGGDMPMMRTTEAQYIPVQRRDPNVSPLPGSSQVPLPRVAAEARAGRESPAEAAAKASAVAGATADAELSKKEAQKLPGRKQVSTLIKKVRAAYEALDEAEAIPSESRGGFANAMDYFASSSLGREAQKMVGTKSSKYLSEIINSRKLLATAIKNATGMSAQEMNSNVELQLTLDALTDPTQGIEAARTTLDTLEELYGAAPAAASTAPVAARTPVVPDAAKQMLRKNPSPQQRAFFDRTFGKGAAAKVLGGR